jgi:hypothetical protein
VNAYARGSLRARLPYASHKCLSRADDRAQFGLLGAYHCQRPCGRRAQRLRHGPRLVPWLGRIADLRHPADRSCDLRLALAAVALANRRLRNAARFLRGGVWRCLDNWPGRFSQHENRGRFARLPGTGRSNHARGYSAVGRAVPDGGECAQPGLGAGRGNWLVRFSRPPPRDATTNWEVAAFRDSCAGSPATHATHQAVPRR